MGGEAKLRQAARAGHSRRPPADRIAFDPGSFHEVGLPSTSVMPQDRDRTPADGKIAGYGRIDSREVGVVSNDFTVMGASSSATNGKKIGHIKRVATQRGMPIVFLGESSGARMPDTMGARGMGTMLGTDRTQYQRMRETPWAAAVLGDCYGSSTWYTCCSDFCRDAQGRGDGGVEPGPRRAGDRAKPSIRRRSAAGSCMPRPPAWSTASSTPTRKRSTRSASSCPTCRAITTKRRRAPRCRRAPAPSPSELAKLLPASRTQVYDVRKIVAAFVDHDSVFELKPQFGKVAVTALARLDGHTVGIVANNPLFKGGALDTDACDKITSFLVLCDSFNIPLVILVDTPGFIIGPEAERRRAPGKIMNFMNALSL